MLKKPELPSELRAALKTCRHSFLTAGFFSLFINLLMLVPALYMLQMYDRVLTSRSESTLLLLTLLVVGLMITLGDPGRRVWRQPPRPAPPVGISHAKKA